MLDMKALEAALAPIGQLGKGEIPFEVNGQDVVLRVLLPDEDIDVQEYAREAAQKEEGGHEQAVSLRMLEHFKRATLSYAIVQIGGMDLRQVREVATGEVLANGTPVWIPKHVAVRKILDGWGRQATMLLFAKYNELLQRVDIEATNSVKYNPSDLDAEIERTEKRLASLKAEKERMEALGKNPAADFVRAVDAAERVVEDTLRTNVRNAAGVTLDEEPKNEPAVEAVAVETVVQPQPPRKPEPPRTPPAAPAAAAEPSAPRQRVMPPVAPPPSRPVPAPVQTPVAPTDDGIVNSMGDSDDAIEAENRRLMAARARARQASLDAVRQEEMAVAPPSSRVPVNRTAATIDTNGGGIEAARPAGAIGDREVYRLPPETLTARGRDPKPPGKRQPIEVDKIESGTPNNPRFKKGAQ